MTLQELLNAIEQFESNVVQITFTNNNSIRGILQNAYSGNSEDPRGYAVPYFFVLRLDLPNSQTEKYTCEETLSISK